MRRYGDGISLVADAQRAGLRTVGVAIHPPLAGDDDQHRVQIERWLPDIDPSLDVWVSHLSPTTYETLPDHAPLQAPARHATCGTATVRRCTSRPTSSTHDLSEPDNVPATGCSMCLATARS